MTSFRLFLLTLFVGAGLAETSTSHEALFTAIRLGAAGEVENLLQSGVSANAVDAEGTSALMAATLFGDARTVGLLLQHGADPNQVGPSGTTALMCAVPNLEKVRLLLEHHADVNARSETGRTALLVAASYPRTVDVLRLLLDRGVDIHAQDKAGATALALAVRSADVDVVRFLVERGLDPNGFAPAALRASAARYDLPTMEYLVSKGVRPTPDLLVTAATWQPAALVTRWLQLGADVNANNAAQYGRTPLLTAVTS